MSNATDDAPKDGPTGDSLGEYRLIDEYVVPVRDVRVAVTMVGGVALAIYECGVALELFRMVHGQGMYGLLKRITQSHAYVDILSGTSAGGINNVCLAAAIANGTDLSSLRDTWMHHAGIDDLLSRPDDRNATTLLRGDAYYFDQIYNQFDLLVQTHSADGTAMIPHHLLPKSPLPSGGAGNVQNAAEIDLFVTGTFYEGQPGAFFDQRGKAVYTESYNGVFHLKHRTDHQESHFVPDLPDAQSKSGSVQNRSEEEPQNHNPARRRKFVATRLARIARTTSSLPAIFEPSGIKQAEMGNADDVISLPKQRAVSYMLDGGFLNNRPLDLVLKAIYRKTASREVVRRVFFVEPVAVGLNPIVGDDPPAPNALQALLFYRDVPGRQSLSGALHELGEQRLRVRQVKELLDSVRTEASIKPKTGNFELNLPSPAQTRLWVNACLQSLRDTLRDLWGGCLEVDNVGGLATGGMIGATEEATEVRQRLLRAKRDALDTVIHSLYEVIFSTCADAGATPDQTSAWRLRDVDVFLLMRLLERARQEVRNFRFPQVPISEISAQGESQAVHRLVQRDSNNSQMRTAAVAAAPADPAGTVAATDVVQEHARDLNHLYRMCEVVQENLITLLQAVPDTQAFQDALKAAAQPATPAQTAILDQAVGDLWQLLRAALVCLLFPVDAGDWLVPADIPALFTVTVQQQRAEEEKRLYRVLTDRTHTVCKRMRPDPDAQNPSQDAADYLKQLNDWYQTQKKEPQNAAAIAQNDPTAPNPESLAAYMNRRLNRILVGTVRDLQPALDARIATLSKTAEGAEAAQSATKAASNDTTLRVAAIEARKKRDVAFSQQYLLWAMPLWQKPDIEEALALADNDAKNPLRHLDIYLYPLEKASGLPSLSEINLVYISPRSEQSGMSEKPTEAKLAGDALAHAGGFLKRSWRANDIMWGRLDSAGAIRDTLLEADRLERLRQADGAFGPKLVAAVEAYLRSGNPIAPLVAANVNDLPLDDTGQVVWNEYQAVRNVITAWAYLPPGQLSADGGKQAVEELSKILLRRHQLDIIAEEVPTALGEALSEYVEMEARGYQSDPRSSRAKKMYQPHEQKHHWQPLSSDDSAKANATSVEEGLREEETALSRRFSRSGDDSVRNVLRQESYDRVRRLFAKSDKTNPASDLDMARLDEYFQKEYNIGSETPFHDIPPLSSLQRIAQSLLVMTQIVSNIASDSGGPVGKKIDSGVLKPLKTVGWIGHSFFTALAQGPSVVLALLALLWSVLILVPFAVAFHVIVGDQRGTSWGIWAIALACAATIALFKHNRRTVFVWVLAVLGALLIVQGLAPKTHHAWKLPLGELLVAGALLINTTLRIGGKNGRRVAFSGLVPLIFATILGLHIWHPGRPHLPGMDGWIAQYLDATAQSGSMPAVPLPGPHWGLYAATALGVVFVILFALPQIPVARQFRKQNIDQADGIIGMELAFTPSEAARIINRWTSLPRLWARQEAEVKALEVLPPNTVINDAIKKSVQQGSDAAARKTAQDVLTRIMHSTFWDFGFAAAYAFLLAVLCLWSARWFAYTPVFIPYSARLALLQMAPTAACIAVVAGFMDWGENAFMLLSMERAKKALQPDGMLVPAPSDKLPYTATSFSYIKWLFVLFSAAYVALGGITAINDVVPKVIRALADDEGRDNGKNIGDESQSGNGNSRQVVVVPVEPIKIPIVAPTPVAIPIAVPTPVPVSVIPPNPVTVPVVTPAPVTVSVAPIRPVVVPIATPSAVTIPVVKPAPVTIPIIAPTPVEIPIVKPTPVVIPISIPDANSRPKGDVPLNTPSQPNSPKQGPK